MCLYNLFGSLSKLICVIIIVIFFSVYYYYIQNNLAKKTFFSLTKSLVEYISKGEKTNRLNETVDQKNAINIGIIPTSRTGNDGGEFLCFFPLFLISLFLFLFCNICPEYCFWKRIKMIKDRYINVEKKCGCNYVYKAKTEP